MRNLKRALSLTLASVMLLGMMVVGTSAAGFPDVDGEDNVEAIEVLQAVSVMVGDKDTGNFRPDAPVSRAEMAVVMSNLLGLTTSYYVSTCPFTDVSGSYDWARGPVGAAYASKVLSGRTATTFDPSATVTAVEAASMIMRGLGYFQYAEDFADGFNVATVRQANLIGLFENIKGDATTPLTRNQVAQMALNALRSEVVDFTGTPGFTANGVTVGYRAEYTPRTGTEAKFRAIEGRSSDVSSDANHRGQYYVQLGEELYDGDLRLDNDATDAFGRPARHWEYDGKDIGTYMKVELIKDEYTTKVTGRMLYELLTSSVIKDYDFNIYVDGVEAIDANKSVLTRASYDAYFTQGNLVRGNTDAVGETGNGVLTQVFVDPTAGSEGEVTIAIINTYLAKANGDYNTKREEASFVIWGLKEVSKQLVKDRAEKTTKPASIDDFDVEDIKDGDIVLVTVADDEIQTISEPEVLSGVTVTGFKSGRTGNLTTGGTKYDYNDTAKYDDSDNESLMVYTDTVINLKEKTYNVWLDANGYVAGVKVVDPEDNYVFITGIDSDYSNISNKNFDAKAIFLDGSVETIKVNAKKSDEVVGTTTGVTGGTIYATLAGGTKPTHPAPSIVNTWYTYTVDKNNVYTLKRAANQYAQDVISTTPVDINEKDISLPKNSAGSKFAFGNDKSVYINVSLANIKAVNPDDATASKLTSVIDDVESVTTGIKNTDITVKYIGTKTVSNKAPDGPAEMVPQYEIYTLWDSGNWIIGCITLNGEDQGVSSEYAYVHSSNIEEEIYTDAEGIHTWRRSVIIDGEETELRYKDDAVNVLANSLSGDGTTDDRMDQGYWYKVYYKADGTVKKVEALEGAIDASAADSGYVDSVPDLVRERKTHNKDLVVYKEVLGNPGDKLEYEDGSLYVTSDGARNGFPVSPNVKVYYINDKKNGGDFDGTDGSETGYSGLTTALSAINNNFNGEVSAIVEKGGASVIVIHCDEQKSGYDPGSQSGKGLSNAVLTKEAANTLTVAFDVGSPIVGVGGKCTKAVFYLVDEDGKSYVFDETGHYDGALGAGSKFTSNTAITKTATYYAVVTVYASHGGAVEATITTPQVNFTP